MRKHVLTLASLLCMALLTMLWAAPRAVAQEQEDQDDPPSRVARLSFARGPVSFNPAGTDDWVDATINRPLTTGDKLWADAGARAAIHIGSASINISESTGFSFLNLTDGVAQLQLTSGTIRVRVKRLGDQENFEIDTPNLAFTVLRPGVYKISVNDTGDTTVIEARSGQGEVTGGGSAYTVNPGDWDTFSGTDQLSANQDVIDDDQNYSDDFEQWSEQRDHHEDNSVSARYVSDDAIGYDDLDDNGAWRPTPEYGNVWFPRGVQADWAPYHYGHWAYVAPWGYTWVDDAAWGFAPFHYGRWVNVNGAWGWIPCPPRPVVRAGYGGPVYVRPVYAPALVAWVGGPGFGVGVAVGGGGGGVGVGVGWFPLGPREVFVPSYHVSRGYVNNVNVSNTTVNTTVVNNYYNTVVVNKTTVNNVTYVNQRVPGAVVATSSQAFSSGQSVSRNVVRVDARQVAAAPVSNFTPAAVPQREAVLGGRTDVRVRPPAAIQTRAVVAKTAPPPPPPAFAQRQEAIKANGGRPVSVAQARQIAPARTEAVAAHPQVKVAPPAKPATPQVVKANPNRQNNSPNGARPGQPAENNNRPGQPAANTQQQPNNNRQPAQENANRPGQPANVQPNNNRPGQPAQENNNRPSQPAANTQQQPNNNRPGQPAQENANRPGQPAANTQQQPNTNRPGQPAANAPAENNRNDRPAQQNNNNRPPQPAVNNQQPPANQNRPNAQPPVNTQQQNQDRQRAEQQQQQQQQKNKQQADQANRQRLQQEEQQKQNQQKPQPQQQQQQPQQREKQQADQGNRQRQQQDEPQRQNQQKQQQQQQKEDKKQQDKQKDKDKDKDKPPKPQ